MKTALIRELVRTSFTSVLEGMLKEYTENGTLSTWDKETERKIIVEIKKELDRRS